MKLRAILAATVALTMGGGMAQAAIIETTYTGVVQSGTSFGAFGITGDLSGKAYTAVYEYNDDVGYRQTNSGYQGQYGSDYLQGGTNTFVGTNIEAEPNPTIFSYLEVNGIRYYIDGSYYSQEAVYQGLEVDSFSGELHESPFRDSFVIDSIGTTAAPAVLGQPLDVEGAAGFDNNAFFIDYPGANASGDLDPTHVTTSRVSAAPEPSAWLLMVAGIGGIGLMLRCRRHSIATV